MFSFLHRHKPSPAGLLNSTLYDDRTFYPAFTRDLNRCSIQAIIESPFITRKRVDNLVPIIKRLSRRGVELILNTRDPVEHALHMRMEAEAGIEILQQVGMKVLYTERHHRKIAILDGYILWEGSLNIFSQNESCEMMRRIESVEFAREMTAFVKIDNFLK